MSDKITKKLTKLRATQDLLQKAHNYVEAYGFDIELYEDTDNGRCCHIGTMRKIAGLDPSPSDSYDWERGKSENNAYKGDGPELVEAFRILDRIAKRKLSETRKDEVKTSWIGKLHGRWVEALGFQIKEAIGDDNQDAEAREALGIYRAALTNVYRQIEKLEAQLD